MIAAIVIGALAGGLAGLLGVGGGVLFVPAIPGAVAGVAIVNVLPERLVKVAFAGLMLVIAAQMVRRAPERPTDAPETGR